MGAKRARVVFVDHCAQLSGAEIALARLVPALCEFVDPLVLLGEEGPLVARLEEAGVEVQVLPLDERTREVRKDSVRSDALDLAAAAAVMPYTVSLARRVRAERADVVHTNSLKAALYGGAAGRLARVPVVWHLRDRIAEDYLPSTAVRAVRAASRVLPSAVVANSSSTLSTLPPHQRRTVVQNVVPGPDLSPAPRGDRPLTLGVVGRLAPWKGQHVFLEAFAAAARGTGVRAVLVGSVMFGEELYEQQLRLSVARLGLTDQVEFRGFREDVYGELSRVDVLVHCSTSPEPFGQVVVEGLAAGLAVVASNEGGPAEVVQHGVDGLLVAPRDPEALARTLRMLIEDPALRQRLGAAGPRVAQRFSPEAAAAGVCQAYRSIGVPC